MPEIRRQPVAAIVPAAGASRRMGEPKLLLPFRGPAGGETVIGSTLAALFGGGAGRICVVTRPGDESLRERLAHLPALLLAVNPEPERGMLSSILAALDALGGPAALAAREEIVLLSPADLPALAPETVAAVVAASRSGAALAVPVHRSGKRGHPLAVAPRRVHELPTLDPTVGLRQLLDRHSGTEGNDLVEVPVDDPGCVRDVDTPEDYRRLASGDPG